MPSFEFPGDQTASSPQMKHCGERRFYAFGTAKLFERRARKLEWKRNSITYLGIIVPLMVGGLVLSRGTEALEYVLVPAAAVSLLQLALSTWSLVAKWDSQHSYALGASQAQTRLFNAWDAMLKRLPADIDARIKELDAEDQRQEQYDLLQNITDREKRFAMRASLYHFGNTCARCGVQPESMTPSDCDTCGNF